MNTLRATTELVGRVLLLILFLYSGIKKVTGYSATLAYMASAGVPGGLLPLVIALEMLGSVAIIVGWQTRVVSILLAGYTLLAAALFHNHFSDQIQAVMFLQDLSIAGAFLMLAANGSGPLSFDARRANEINQGRRGDALTVIRS
jgi:putative oxidoreductase